MVRKRDNKNKSIDKVYKKYKNLTNMNYNELLQWSKNDLSKKASLNRSPIRRNLKLLSKKKDDWTWRDWENANKTISYISRAKKIPRSSIIYNGYTRNEIALKNWGFDVKK